MFKESSDQIVNDYLEGKLSVTEISEKYNINDDTISKWLKRLGIHDSNRQFAFANKTNYYTCWIKKHGEQEAERLYKEHMIGVQSRVKTGPEHPRYGRGCPMGAGNGYKGWYRGHYFRSLKEAGFMIDLDSKNISWESAERKELTIPYIFYGKHLTYKPDFKVGNIIYEIKPINLHKSPRVSAKAAAAIKFCSDHDLIYELIDFEINPDALKQAYDIGEVMFDRDYESKFLSFFKD